MDSVARELGILILLALPFQSMLRLHRITRRWNSLPLRRCFRPARLSLVPSKLLLYMLRNNLITGAMASEFGPIVWTKRRDRWVKQFDLNHICGLSTWDYHDLQLQGQGGVHAQTIHTKSLRLSSVNEVLLDCAEMTVLNFHEWINPFRSASVWRIKNMDVVRLLPYFWHFDKMKELYTHNSGSKLAIDGKPRGSSLTHVPLRLQVLDCPDYVFRDMQEMFLLRVSQLLFIRDRYRVWQRKSIKDAFVESSFNEKKQLKQA